MKAEEAAKAIWLYCQRPSGNVVSEMELQLFNQQASDNSSVCSFIW